MSVVRFESARSGITSLGETVSAGIKKNKSAFKLGGLLSAGVIAGWFARGVAELGHDYTECRDAVAISAVLNSKNMGNPYLQNIQQAELLAYTFGKCDLDIPTEKPGSKQLS